MAKISGIHTPVEIKNLAINGALDFWQRVEGTTTTVNTASTVNAYYADQIKTFSGGATVKNYSVQRSSDVPSLSQAGFDATFSQLVTCVTGIASPAATDQMVPFIYNMEGNDFAKLHQKIVTIGFWWKTSVAGTYSLTLGNVSATRNYTTTFTASANTWEFKTFTIQLDVGGTWAIDNTLGLALYIGAVTGANFQTSSLNSWQAGNLMFANTATNWFTAGATLQMSMLSIVEGPLGFASTGFARQGKNIQQELALCQRYYVKSYSIGTALGASTNVGLVVSGNTSAASHGCIYVPLKVSMRASPAFSFWDAAGNATKMSFFSIANFSRTDNQAGFITTFIGDGYIDVDFITTNFGAAACGAVHFSAEAGL